jgi:ribonuclease III
MRPFDILPKSATLGLPDRDLSPIIKYLNAKPERVDWIYAALAHRSAQSLFPESARVAIIQVLNVFGALGKAIAPLFLLETTYNRDRHITSNEASTLVAKQSGLFSDALVSLCHLTQLMICGASLDLTDQRQLATGTTAVAMQLVGALYLSDGYTQVRHLLRAVLQSMPPVQPSSVGVNYKSLLQEYSQGRTLGAPVYSVTNESGPDHQKRFEVEVRLGQRTSEKGTGQTIKSASMDAAKLLLQRIAPHILSSSSDLAVSSRTPAPRPLEFSLLSAERRHKITQVATLFGLSNANLPRLLCALTHTSYKQVHPSVDTYSGLAHLGSNVLNVAVLDFLVRRYFRGSPSPAAFRYLVLGAADLLQLGTVFEFAKSTGVDEAVLRGPGQAPGATIAADAFQAVLAVRFASRSHPASTVDLLPSVVKASLDSAVGSVPGPISSLSRLQELLQLLGLKLKYAYAESGPDHDRTVLVSANLSDELSQSTGFLLGAKARTRREGESNVAKRLLGDIAAINSCGANSGPNAMSAMHGNSLLIELLLRSELRHLPTLEPETAIWVQKHLFCSDALAAGRLGDFFQWLSEALARGRLIEESGSYTQLIGAFLKQVKPITAKPFRDCYAATFLGVREFVDSLDPEGGRIDPRSTSGFAAVLSIVKVLKLLAEPLQDFSLAQIGHLLVSLSPRFEVSRRADPVTGSDMTAFLRGQVLSAFLESVVSDCSCVLDSTRPVYLDSLVEGALGFILLSVPVLDPGVASSLGDRHPLLWQFYKVDLPLTATNIRTSCVEFVLGPYPSSECDSSTILRSYLSAEYLHSDTEMGVAARLMHDLKNLITAYSLCILHPAETITEKLELRVRASRHKDQATTLLASLSSLETELINVSVDYVEPTSLIRAFMAEVFPTTPNNIRLLPPRVIEENPFCTNRELLSVVIRNLCQNALEALAVGGGDVSFEVLRLDNRLLIEIADNGPGLSSEKLERILAGLPVASNKRSGSGLGMLTVHTALRRLHGELNGTSKLGEGTTWTVTLTALSDGLQRADDADLVG